MNTELITAYIDNEISNPSLIDEINHKIHSDSQLKFEYDTQRLCKKIVKEKLTRVAAPEYLRNRIISEIKPKEVEVKQRPNFLINFFYKPSFSFATALVIVMSIVLIIVNRFNYTTAPEIDLANLKADNMFLQAVNNYSLILKGQLKPQLISDKPDEINSFFASNGVNYSTLVPEFKEWKLLGAVISEDKGTKLAHHVYVGNNQQIIYVFQVDEEYINSVVELDTKLINYLNSGNCYSKELNNNLVLFTKVGHNICAVIANDDFNYVKNNFCNLN